MNRDHSTGPRAASAVALQGVLWGLLSMAGAASAAPVEILKEMPRHGTVRHGEVVYVEDARCRAGMVRKITGGDERNGTPRQSECVKRPDEAAPRS